MKTPAMNNEWTKPKSVSGLLASTTERAGTVWYSVQMAHTQIKSKMAGCLWEILLS